MFRLALAFALLATPASALVKHDAMTRSLTIAGPTTTIQWVEINKALSTGEVDTVFLGGPGGDYYAGLAIGRLIKAHNLRVVIPTGVDCASACAFVALGAAELHLDGRLMFHSPFRVGVETSKSILEIAKEWSQAYFDMTRYLVEMGYPMALSEYIAKETSPCILLVVSETDKMLRYKGAATDRPNIYIEAENACRQPAPRPGY
jgi:hypothetical protein